MERPLVQPLAAEVVTADGGWSRVELRAYLGADRWRAAADGGADIVVAAGQILTVGDALATRGVPHE